MMLTTAPFRQDRGADHGRKLQMWATEIISFKRWTPCMLKEKWITKINLQIISNKQTCDDRKLFTHN